MEDNSSRDSFQKDNQDGKQLLMMLRDSRQSSLGDGTHTAHKERQQLEGDIKESYPGPSQVEIGVNSRKNKNNINQSENVHLMNNMSGHTNNTHSQVSRSNEDTNSTMFNKSRYVGLDGKMGDKKMMQTQIASAEASNTKLTVQVKQQIAKRNVPRENGKATVGSQLPNGAELLKFSEQPQNEAGAKQFAHLQLQRKGQIAAQNYNGAAYQKNNFVVNEYGQDVASHHFSTKVNNRKNTGSRTKTSQANKSALLKHPAAAQYQLYRQKDNQSQLSPKRGGPISSPPSNRDKQLDRSISVDEFNSGISGIPGIIPLNKSNVDQNSQMYSTQVNYGGFIPNTYVNMKRPISMGNFPGSKNRDQKGGHRQSENLLRGGELMKSHASLLYSGPKDAYQMQQQIEAQQQQIQYLTQLNEQILENRYHSSLSQIDNRAEHQLENHVVSHKQISENKNVKINDLIQNQGYQSAKQQFFKKQTDLQGSDTNSQSMLQRSQQSNIFTANTAINDMYQTKKLENTIGASTEADINSLMNPDRQSSSRNLDMGAQFFNKRNYTQDYDPKTVFRVRTEVEKSKRNLSNDRENSNATQPTGQELTQIIDQEAAHPQLLKDIANDQHLASLKEFQDTQLLKAQIINDITFAGNLDLEEQTRYKSVENDKSQFININNVNVINVNAANADGPGDFVIGNPSQNIFDQKVPTIQSSGREEALHSKSQNRLATTDSFFNSKRHMETAPSIFQSHQGPQRLAQKKAGGLDISLVRKEWRKFKVMLDNQEYHLLNVGHDKKRKEKPEANCSDGLGNLALLIDQPSLSKLPELKSILQSLQTQILRQFQKQKKDHDIVHDQLHKNCARKDKDYEKLLRHYQALQDQLQEDQESLGRFLKKENKGRILDQIQEYEALGKLDPEETMDIESYEYKLAKKLKEEMHRQTHKYSECRRNLKEMDYLLSLSGGTGNLQGVGGVMKEDEEYDAIVQTIEESITKSFQGLQLTTARKVLERCLKRVVAVDCGTQMGHDMFTEERLKFEDRISELEIELEDLDSQVNSGWKEISQLKKEKISQSQQIQELKQKAKDAEFLHKEQGMRYLEQNLRLQQLQDMAGTKIKHLQDLEADKADLKGQVGNLKSSIEHLQESLAQKRSKKRAYKRQAMDLQAGKAPVVRPGAPAAAKVQDGVSQSAHEEVQLALRIAKQRLGQGLRRHVRQVKRFQAKELTKGKKAKADGKAGADAEEDSGDLTDESYYEHPPAPKATTSEATSTEDLPKLALKVITGGKRDQHGNGNDSNDGVYQFEQHPQFLDLLNHEIYIQVMQTAGAIPKGQAFKTMTEEAARQSIAAWYKGAVTKKFAEEKRERSPEVRAQRALSRKLRRDQKDNSIGGEARQKKASGSNVKEGRVPNGKDDYNYDDDLSETTEDEVQKAGKLASAEVATKTIKMISEDLISRVRIMRARLTAGDENSENESSKSKQQRAIKEDQEHEEQILMCKLSNMLSSQDGSIKHGQTGASFQNTPGSSERFKAQQAFEKQESLENVDLQATIAEATGLLPVGQSSNSTPGLQMKNARDSQFDPIKGKDTLLNSTFKQDKSALEKQNTFGNTSQRQIGSGNPLHQLGNFAGAYFKPRPVMTNAGTCTSADDIEPKNKTGGTQTQEIYFPLDDATQKAIANILGNKLSKSSDNLNQIAHCFQSYFNRMHVGGQYQQQSYNIDLGAVKRLYPSYEPKHKKYERIPLNYRNKAKSKKRDVGGSVMKTNSSESQYQKRASSTWVKDANVMLKGNISSYRGSEERQFNESFPGLKSQTATLLHSQSQSALKNNNSINKNEKYSSLEEEDNDYHVPQFNVKITGDTIGESAEYTNETQKTTLNKKSL